jgi:large subunit ribosomal protein L10
MARPDKAAAVAELSERFSSSTGVVLTEYRGLSVKALGELRRSLGDDATYAVSKNTLTTIAAHEAGVSGVDDLLVGPTAIAFISGDPVNVAKGLRDFGRANPLLIIKGGVLEGRVITPEEVRRLADLESREVLLAKVAGSMQGILQQAISLISAPLSQAARLVAALEQAAAENPSLLAAGDAQPEPTNADLAAAEDTSEPTNAELAATEDISEPSNEELAASAATAAPAAPTPSTETPPRPPESASAAEDQ